MDDAQADLIRRIASVVGHELRNPMAVINNSAYFVKAKLGQGALDPKVEKHLKIIESEIARADGLISDILAYSRKCEPTADIRAMDLTVKEAVDSFKTPAGCRLDFKPGAKDAKVKTDAQMLSDSLQRLIDNAFAAQDGKGTVKVATGAGKEGVWVSVSDTGTGVDTKVKDNLFEPFVTTKPRGLGLGLALVKKLITANGGSAHCESGPQGSTFRLILPKA
ncbi:MAG: HAMP domain-containing sensor histidine kinase [Elusimicrobiota bacterium]